MKSSPVPGFCGIALATMLAVGGQHWWSVRQQVTAWHAAHTTQDQPSPVAPSPVAGPAQEAPIKAPAPLLAAKTPTAAPSYVPAAATPNGVTPEFLQKLVDELKSVKQENQNLHDQVAETNRDLIELGFRVDSHSESFRPLKIKNDDPAVNREPNMNSRDFLPTRENEPGVLPPRAILPASELPVQ